MATACRYAFHFGPSTFVSASKAERNVARFRTSFHSKAVFSPRLYLSVARSTLDRSSSIFSDNGGSGGASDGGSNGGGDGGNGEEGNEGEEESHGDYGPILGLEKINESIANAELRLPEDMAIYAAAKGIPALLLERYIALQRGWLAPLVRFSPAVRDRLLVDPSFLFKVFAEVAIDSCCATFAEVNKRGPDFWKEFDLYASDLMVGIVLDIALVGMLAPTARFALSKVSSRTGLKASIGSSLAALPSSIFEASLPGQQFTIGQRVATWFVKGAQYGVAGFACGLVGQGIANGLIRTKRHFRVASESDEEDVKLPELIPSALLWGVFMAVSSNTRYQVVNGMERVVETSVVGRRIPLMASAFTVGVRFGNNVYGGMQFVDWARWSGVQ